MNIDRYFETRRTIRKFSDREVSAQEIKVMLEAAMHAPTTGNMQLYSVVVTRDPEKKKQLEPMHFSQPASVNAPVLLTFCADINRFVRWCECSKAQAGFDNLQSLFSAVFDTTIYAQQFVTIAEQQGMGTCYLGTTTYNVDGIAKLLELPARVVPLLTIALGWPEGESAVSERLPVEAVMHDEVYHGYSDADIARLYHDIDTNPANRKFIEENGKETLAQVFADVRYPKATNETFSKVLSEFLEKSKLI